MLFSCFSFISLADTTIQMEEYNGVYRIPCIVNGAKMKFIFDTGASNVCISMAMAEYLYDNDFIKQEDIIGTGTSSVADGRIVDHIKLKLKDIQIEDLHIHNVEAVVIDGQNAPLLMGQSAIQKLGSIEINGSTLTIHNDNGGSQDDYVRNLYLGLAKARSNRLDEKALEYFDILSSMGILSDFELYDYAGLLCSNEEYSKALDILNSIKDVESLLNGGWDVYSEYAWNYFFLGDYNKALRYNELSGRKFITSMEHLDKMSQNKEFEGDCYYYLKLDKKASDSYWISLAAYAKSLGIEPNYLWDDCKGKLKKNQKSYRNDKVDNIAFKFARSATLGGVWSVEGSFTVLSALAKAGNSYAMNYLNDAGINPYDF